MPTDEALGAQMDRRTVDIVDYKVEMTQRFSEAWRLAQEEIGMAQGRQKKAYDWKARQSDIQVGSRVFVYKPSLN